MKAKSNESNTKPVERGPEIHAIPAAPSFVIPLKQGMRLFNSYGNQVVVVEIANQFFYVESDGNFYKFKGSEEFIAYADFTEENFTENDSRLTFSLPSRKRDIVITLIDIREKVASYMLTTFLEEFAHAVDSDPDSTPADEALSDIFRSYMGKWNARYPLCLITKEITSSKSCSQGTRNAVKELIAKAVKYEQGLLESAGFSEVKGF